MTVQDLHILLDDFPDEAKVVISLFRADGTVVALHIDGVDEDTGIVHLETSEAAGIIY